MIKDGFLYGFKKIKYYILGFLSGILNGFFGAGGGLFAVPMLRKAGINPKSSHATSIAIIAPLCALSGSLTFFSGEYKNLSMLYWLIPAGLIGAWLGAILLKKLNTKILGIVFSLIMISSAVRLLIL